MSDTYRYYIAQNNRYRPIPLHRDIYRTVLLYTVHCTPYTVHCTLFTVHYTLYTALYALGIKKRKKKSFLRKLQQLLVNLK